MSNRLPAMPAVSGVDHRFVDLSDGRMHVAEAGSGEPVVMLSGFGQSWWEWRDVMPPLAERFHVLAPDMRGEGWSELPAAAITRTKRLDDVLELLDELGLEKVRLVSHDMTAITAYQLALTHPERVVAHVMLAVPPPQMRFSANLLPGMRHLWFQEALAIPGLGPRLLRGGRLPRWLFAHFAAAPLPDDVVELYVALMREPSRAHAGGILVRRMVVPELLRIIRGAYRADRFEMPTLVAFGTEDPAFPSRVMVRVLAEPSDYGRDFRFELIQDAAHFVVDERPAETAELVIDFFAR